MTSHPPGPSEALLEHGRAAGEEFRLLRPQYEALVGAVRSVLEQCLVAEGIRVHSVQARAKDVESFARKASTPSAEDTSKPKYTSPLTQITDVAALRIITLFPRHVSQVEAVIQRELEVLERTDKAEALIEEERFGYQSIHYLARLSEARTTLPEYARHAGRMFEVQVRTLLQHAWAEIEHSIQYKSAIEIPPSIRRRFAQLAGILEVADREFQAIQDDDETLRRNARLSVAAGRLGAVDLTSDALKAFLDQRFGADGRMSEFSYHYETQNLRSLGFATLGQLEACISGFDADRVSRAVWGSRQGQLSRLSDVVLASMGDEGVLRHRFGGEPWFIANAVRRLERMSGEGVVTGAYRPTPSEENARKLVLEAALAVARGVIGSLSPQAEEALGMLPPRDAKVLRLCYGFDGGRIHTDSEVAQMLGIADLSVRDLRDASLRRLASVAAPAA